MGFTASLERALLEVMVHGRRLDGALARSPPAHKRDLALAASAVLRRPDTFTITGKYPWNDSTFEVDSWVREASFEAARLVLGLGTSSGTALSGRSGRRDATKCAFPPSMLQEWELSWGAAKCQELATLLSEPAGTSFFNLSIFDR